MGWMLAVFAAAGVAFALSDGADVYTDEDASEGGSIVQVILGLLFVFLAIKQWRGRPREGVEPEPPKIYGAVGSMSRPKLFGLGVGAAVANPANLPLAISGGLALAQGGAHGAEGLIAVALFTLLACSSVLIPIAAFMILGERTREPLGAIKARLLANNATILFILFTLLAAKMLGSGLALI